MTYTDRLAAVTDHREEPRASPEIRPATWALVLLLTAIAAIAYSYLGLERTRSYRSGAYDLGLFHEAVLNLSDGHGPSSALKGFAEGGSSPVNLWGDHSHYVIALWAPLYRLYPHPVTLILQQAVLFASSLPAVWLVARRRIGGVVAPFIALVAAAAAWGTTSALDFDVHEVAFALPFMAWGIERGLAGRWRAATIWLLLLLLVKEDEGPTVIALGIWMAILGKRLLGALTAVAGVAGFLLTTRVLIPAVSGQEYAYWSYNSLGKDAPAAIKTIIEHPVRAFEQLYNTHQKVVTLRDLLLPAGIFAVFSPLLVVLLPMLAARFLSDDPALWGLTFHYSALPCLVLVMAAVDSLGRVKTFLAGRTVAGRSVAGRSLPGLKVAGRTLPLARLVPVAALAGLLVQTYLVSAHLNDGWRSVFGNTRLPAASRAQYDAAVAAVPHGVGVTASNQFVPHLLDRCGTRTECTVRLLEIGTGAATGPGGKRTLTDAGAPPTTPYVLVDLTRPNYPDDDPGLARLYVTTLEARGWVPVYTGSLVEVLHQP